MAKIWTEEDHNKLSLMVKQHSRKYLAEYFGVTVSSIDNKLKRLGLTLKNKNRGDQYFFKIIDTEEKAYWLGFIYADGYVISNYENGNFELGIELSSIDVQHLHKFNRNFNDYYKITTRKRSMDSLTKLNDNVKLGRMNEMCNIRIYSKSIVEDLISNGLVQNKTKSDIFPKIVDEKLFFHFLRGYIDGDGSYTIRKAKTTARTIEYPRVSITGNNKYCFEYIQGRLKPYGITSCISKDGESWKLFFNSKEGNIKLINLLFNEATVYLDRKFKKANKLLSIAV